MKLSRILLASLFAASTSLALAEDTATPPTGEQPAAMEDAGKNPHAGAAAADKKADKKAAKKAGKGKH